MEMQGRNIKDNYGKRTEYHVAHLLNHYTPKGTPWEKTPKVYQISVLNFYFDEEEKDCFNHYLLRNEHGRSISETINVIFLELPKVALLKDDIKTLTAVEMWGKFFLYANKPEKQDFVEELAKANRGIRMAVRVLKNISQDELNWYHESRYWMQVSDEKTMKNAAKRTGHAEGLAEGLAEGRVEGAQQKALEAAKNLLKMNVLSYEQIAQAQGLSLEEVQKLAKELSK